MISGTINSRHEIIVPFAIQDAAGNLHPVEALLDTGFNAALSLPALVISALGLVWETHTMGILADGTVKQFDSYTLR